MKTTRLLICAVAFAAAVSSTRVNGQTLASRFEGISLGAQLQGTWTNGEGIHSPPVGISSFSDFDAFCVEPTQGIEPGQEVVYQIQDPTSLTNYDRIARLIGAFLASSRSAADAAAVQWAIWESTSEFLLEPSLADGSARLIGGAPELETIGLANEFLNNASKFEPVTLTYLRNDQYQDMVSWNVIPEPSSLGLAVLSGLLLFRRRRN
jgi:hypothetical protein